MMHKSFSSFLKNSPSVYHAAEEIKTALLKADFKPLQESEKWELQPGKGYFVLREDSLLAAFRAPLKTLEQSSLLAVHLDSPSLKLKPHPDLTSSDTSLLGLELYGSPLLYSWLDKELAICGRVFFEHKKKLQKTLVFFNKTPVLIPSLAIHLNREVNEKGLLLQKQDHLRAICSLQGKGLRHLLPQNLLSFDLFLAPLEEPSSSGIDQELFSSYRLDNLASSFSSLEALVKAKASKNALQMVFFWHHEEIGSQTSLGADSIFAHDLLKRVSSCFKIHSEEFDQMKSRSFCLSCDLAHGSHPNYPEKHDPQNTPFLGKGPVLKFSPRYATNGMGAALITHLAKKHQIPLQTYAPRSDIPSGSTVGSMMAASLGILTADVGVSCWGMHSSRETIAMQDQIFMTNLLKYHLEEGYGPF